MKYIMIIPPYEAMKKIVDRINPKMSLIHKSKLLISMCKGAGKVTREY
jgi:hypothetical protein